MWTCFASASGYVFLPNKHFFSVHTLFSNTQRDTGNALALSYGSSQKMGQIWHFVHPGANLSSCLGGLLGDPQRSEGDRRWWACSSRACSRIWKKGLSSVFILFFLNRYRFQITHPYSMSPEHGWEGWCCGRGVGMADVSDGALCDQQEGSCQPWHEHLLRRDQAVLENESALWLSSYISPINQRMGNSTIYSSFLCSIQLSSPIAV